jgi:Rad3-related DNA helicase
MLATNMDKVLEHYKGRRGIVFTVSYPRAKWLQTHSKWSDRMILHDTAGVGKAVAKWKQSKDGVLVSPSVVEGWDLPEADFIVVAKVPWPDTTGPVNKARVKDDPQWAPFIAMQTLVQECGRGTRSETDHCDVWVLDDSVKWFWASYNHYAPKWFRERWMGSVKEVKASWQS